MAQLSKKYIFKCNGMHGVKPRSGGREEKDRRHYDPADARECLNCEKPTCTNCKLRSKKQKESDKQRRTRGWD